LGYKGTLDAMPSTLTPWFRYPSVRRAKRTVIGGHWSAIGLHQESRFIGLDSGCIWGGALTALRLEDGKIFQEPCRERNHPTGWD
jgi:bis(5'-nucleosyl)-tetraphosphatase (symmetrical)